MTQAMTATTEMTAEQQFATIVRRTAERQLNRMMGEKRGQASAQAVTMSIMGAMQASREPGEFMRCTADSVANCVALSHRTGLLPGGPNPDVYLVPQRSRQGEAPELQWRITHRGLGRLAYDAGFAIQPVPVSTTDHLVVSFGEATEHSTDPDSWPRDYDELRGVIVVVRRLSDSVTLSRIWMPRIAIDQRRAASRAWKKHAGPWMDWPIEMSQKTAILWAFARGLVPLSSPSLDEAIRADDLASISDGAREVVEPVGESLPPAGKTSAPWRAPKRERALQPAAVGDDAGTMDSDGEPVSDTAEDVQAAAEEIERKRERATKAKASVDELASHDRGAAALERIATICPYEKWGIDEPTVYAALDDWLRENKERTRFIREKDAGQFQILLARIGRVNWLARLGIDDAAGTADDPADADVEV